MKTIRVKKTNLNPKEYVKRTCMDSHARRLITEPTTVVDDETGETLIVYTKLTQEFTQNLRWAVSSVKYPTSKRTGGLLSTSTTFGYSPRRKMFKDVCCTTAMASNEPKQFVIMGNFAEKLSLIYKEHFPKIYERHKELVTSEVLPDWRLPGDLFTSGICNKNNQLAYHFDSGNFKGNLSNMVVFRNGDSRGGYLVCPEYDIKFECADNYLVMFDGQSILHGVSPIEGSGTRYTIVYYALQQMRNCLIPSEELKRVRKSKLETEKRRLDPEHNKKLLEARFKNRENPGYQKGIYAYKKHGGKKLVERKPEGESTL